MTEIKRLKKEMAANWEKELENDRDKKRKAHDERVGKTEEKGEGKGEIIGEMFSKTKFSKLFLYVKQSLRFPRINISLYYLVV